MNFDIKKEELKTMYNNRKSFYKKAYIEYYIEWSELHSRVTKIKLYSYNSIVCTVEYVNTTERFYHLHNMGLFSQTTLKHIKEFLLQLFYCKDIKLTKKDILNNRGNKYDIKKGAFVPLPF